MAGVSESNTPGTPTPTLSTTRPRKEGQPVTSTKGGPFFIASRPRDARPSFLEPTVGNSTASSSRVTPSASEPASWSLIDSLLSDSCALLPRRSTLALPSTSGLDNKSPQTAAITTRAATTTPATINLILTPTDSPGRMMRPDYKTDSGPRSTNPPPNVPSVSPPSLLRYLSRSKAHFSETREGFRPEA